MTKTGYLWDPGFLGHFTSTVHPENPERARILDPQRLVNDLPGLVLLKNERALGLPWVKKIHSNEYIKKVEDTCTKGMPWLDKTGDTSVSRDSFNVALYSAAGALSVTKAVMEGQIDNGFAAIRPPGHHAGPEYAKGFCVFNNVAICAKFAQEFYGLKNILVLDWDVHPGDGTMLTFYEDPSVHFVSIHQDGIFGKDICTRDQRGKNEGTGTTYNIPLDPGSKEPDYLRELEPGLRNALERCKPELILVSCGFDAHRGDPLGKMQLDESSFQRFTEIMKEAAKKYCDGKLVSILEGGYNIDILKYCTRAHLETLMD